MHSLIFVSECFKEIPPTLTDQLKKFLASYTTDIRGGTLDSKGPPR